MRKGECRHFNGIQNTHCAAGICYQDVTPQPERETGRALRIPCIQVFNWSSPAQLAEFEKRGTCEKYNEPTQEEIDSYEAETEAAIAQYFTDIDDGICPNHKTPINQKQVGSCVYALPCGCRLYQGTVSR